MTDINQLYWVKNIKRDDGTGWAYMEKELNNEFNLNFSKSQKRGAIQLNVGEVILLFQRVDKIKGVIPRTYLTHLVTPIDDELYYNPDLPKFPYERRVAVIAKASPNTAISVTADQLNFYKPNWGKLCEISLLNDTLTEDQIRNKVWNLFRGHFNESFKEYFQSITSNIDPALFEAMEGQERIILKNHLIRERNPELVRRAKQSALKQFGDLICECCKFSFHQKYGSIGQGFIECHHRQPISIGGERLTSTNDLALVCSNCHRMLHKKNMLGNYYSVEELKEIVFRH